MSLAFNELVLDLNDNKCINCGNVGDWASECRSWKSRRKIYREWPHFTFDAHRSARSRVTRAVRATRACVRAYARERAGSAFCFGGFGLPAAGLWSSGFYGLHDGIYLKRPAAVIRLLWTFVTPTRASDRVRKTTHRRARVGFRKLSLSAHRDIVKIARHRVDRFRFYMSLTKISILLFLKKFRRKINK